MIGTTSDPEAIFRACSHDGPRDSYLTAADGAELRACWRCGNAANEARRAARKAELDERPKDCQRCARRPHTWIYGPYRLCGRCKTATEREHHAAAAGAGTLAIFATSPLVDTSAWAGQ